MKYAKKMREDSRLIIDYAIDRVMPGRAVEEVLEKQGFSGGRVFLVGVGKAAWKMTEAAINVLNRRKIPFEKGIVLTKYGHIYGELEKTVCLEAGHPVPDENSFKGTEEILKMTRNLNKDDTVLFLLSGGGSALFEDPATEPDEMAGITDQLLAAGADIVEVNSVRKRLSNVKGGRFAEHCAPAKVVSVILSDIIGNPVDMIASGPACVDSSTCADALKVVEEYGISLSEKAREYLKTETPKSLSNVESHICGSVNELCESAMKKAEELGYEPVLLTETLDGEAKEAGRFFGAIGRFRNNPDKNTAYIAGGETVVYVTGDGKGGRNQEMALAVAKDIAGISNVLFFSVGSDGTDGPTDAAGGIADGYTLERMAEAGIDAERELENNNSYEALKAADGLVITGPTGTNVNDLSVLLIQKK